ncbi:MAG: ABC transporter permease [Erysipelotrichales bacterium]|nr:ABC transporter permease [Erysipelotrichales bacterium]
MKLFKDLYAYRELLKSNVKKDIRGKYKGSFLGVLWSFVSPLLMTLVYAIVFPYLMRGAGYEHYTTFLVIGILPWTWFTTSIAQGTWTIIGNGAIIKKVYFPREILPISIVTSGVINFLISCVIIALFLIFSGIGFSIYILFLPLVILAQYLLTLGIIFITSAVNVYIRDLEYIINFIIQMLFYGTPILYSLDMFSNAPVVIKTLIELNPMATIITSYRDILYWGNMPHLKSILFVILFSLVLCVFGLAIFRKLSKGFAEEV